MLNEYARKRHFPQTPEPPPAPKPGEGSLIFVVQKHAARRLHYDLRLELDGALKSWAVPHGPSLDPTAKRLAVMVEDHPLDYASFEGTIPEGEYGAGQVIVWDRGVYSPDVEGKLFFEDRPRAEAAMRDGLARGKVSLFLRGQKLNGSFALVKMAHREKEWLLIKHRDEFADPGQEILERESSVLSGLGIEDLRKNPAATSGKKTIDLSSVPGARKADFSSRVAPMLATLAGGPFTDPRWVFEPKLDGYRILAAIRQGKITLLSRRGLDVTREYPHLLPLLKEQPVTEALLDGEAVALDEAGRPCFQCLQNHLELMRQTAYTGEMKTPVVYYLFDILHLDGYDLRGAPLRERRRVLESAIRPSDYVRLVEQFEGDGPVVFEAAVANGLEGVIAKRKDSVYESGRRSRDWLKIKTVLTDDFVIGGYTQGEGARSHAFGALLIGYYDEQGRLVYAGHVGTGFDDRTLTDLLGRFEPLRTDQCPFAEPPPLHAPTTWIRPELVTEVKFSEWTQEGYLRAPVFLRLREDKAPSEVRRGTVNSAPAVEAAAPPQNSELEGVILRIQEGGDSFTLELEGHRLKLTNLEKALWPSTGGHADLTKRDFLLYLARVSPFLLPHLRDRPLTLTRYPDGVSGERFYQKHWEHTLPPFVREVRLFSEHENEWAGYLICNNLPSLLWLGQLADLELHTWFSRINAGPDTPGITLTGNADEDSERLSRYPDFIIFDLDPYLYSGQEKKGAEPELNRAAFTLCCEVAGWLKEVLDSLSLSSFVKTSGRTGLHVYVPILRQLDSRAVHSAAGTIARFLLQYHPKEVTTEWTVEKRTGKVFVDYNQNVHGKTLACAYSPRPTPGATVSTPISWNELSKVYPTDFTIATVPDRVARLGDPWANILNEKRDLKQLLKLDSTG